jgi:hypothetical protein
MAGDEYRTLVRYSFSAKACKTSGGHVAQVAPVNETAANQQCRESSNGKMYIHHRFLSSSCMPYFTSLVGPSTIAEKIRPGFVLYWPARLRKHLFELMSSDKCCVPVFCVYFFLRHIST